MKNSRHNAKTNNKLNPHQAMIEPRPNFPTPLLYFNFTIIVLRYGELLSLDYRCQPGVHTSNTSNDFALQSLFTRVFSPRKRTQESPR